MFNFISVVICTYSREKYIGICLDHLHRQQTKKDKYEVIIVDNNSPDRTALICQEKITQYSETNFNYFLETNQGHSHARNRGIQEAKGNIICFLDDDAFVTENYIQHVDYFFNNHPTVGAIGGKIIPQYENSAPEWLSQHLLPLVAALDMGNQIKPFRGRKFPIGANMAFRKIIFEQYGLFNTQLGRKGTGLEGGDEKEIFLRLKKDNVPIYYVPQVLAQHIIPDLRLTHEYIRGQAIGVGVSERKRLKNSGVWKWIEKIADEVFKSAATLFLSFCYLVLLQFKKSVMLIKFRIWVLKGLLK